MNLVDTLNGGEFTVFAPTDDAFAKIAPATIDTLKTDAPLLTDILTYHVVPGRLSPAELVGTHKTVEGKDLTVTGMGNGLKVNDASTSSAATCRPPTRRCTSSTRADAPGRACDVVVANDAAVRPRSRAAIVVLAAISRSLRSCPPRLAPLRADGSAVASIFITFSSRIVSTTTANSRPRSNASSTGSPAGPPTTVAPGPR